MTFKRKDYYGSDFIWFAVDNSGCIAQFTSGFNPIPEKIFQDKLKYEMTEKYFQNLPAIIKSYLSPKYEKIKNRSLNNFADCLEDARRGLFIFEESVNTKYDYDLNSLPEEKLKILELPKDIQNYLNSFVFNSIKFSEIEGINVLDYFTCDLTPQDCK